MNPRTRPYDGCNADHAIREDDFMRALEPIDAAMQAVAQRQLLREAYASVALANDPDMQTMIESEAEFQRERDDEARVECERASVNEKEKQP